MSESTLGELPDDSSERDAIHVAIIPMVSQETLLPGDRVIINGFLQAEKTDEDDEDFIGIVDPFLPYQRIYPGTKFYLCLKPNSVTGMRHHWKHPLFCEKEKRQNLIEWFEAQVGRRT